MLTVYSQQRDQVIPIINAWITSENEVIGLTTTGKEIILGEYDTDTQAQEVLNKIYQVMPEPKFKLPKTVPNRTDILREIAEEDWGCRDCAYETQNLSEEEDNRYVNNPDIDPCETCTEFSNFKEKSCPEKSS